VVVRSDDPAVENQGPIRIVVAESYDEAALTRLAEVGSVTQLEACDEATLGEAVLDAHALLVRSTAKVSRGVIGAGKCLRVIGRGGVGLENVDIEAARERDISVVYTPDAATGAVADLTVGLMIALVRGLRDADTGVRTQQFTNARRASVGRDMADLTIGIVGLGRIGRAVARRCRNGFGCRILYNDIVDPGWLDFSATATAKGDLFATSDIVSLHVPLTDETRGLIDERCLARFKRGAFLINTARGRVVQNAALVTALKDGHLAGAALDVFEQEPAAEDDPILGAPNTLFTPHIGARTTQGLDRMNLVVEDVIRVLRGEAPEFPAWQTD